MAPSWTNLVRFISEEDGQIHLGEVDSSKYPDVGIAILNGERVAVKLVKGSIFDGTVTNTVVHIARVCTPHPNTRNPTFELSGPFETASGSHWNRRSAHYPVHGTKLSRPCQGGKHAHSGCAGPFCQAAHGTQRTLSRKDKCAKNCTGWL